MSGAVLFCEHLPGDILTALADLGALLLNAGLALLRDLC